MLADRHPATRNPEAAYLTKYWQEPWFERTLGDLAAERPALIAAIADPIWPPVAARPLLEIPKVSEWIKENYRCDNGLVRGVTICVRGH